MQSQNDDRSVSRRRLIILLTVGGLAAAFCLTGWFLSRGRHEKKTSVPSPETVERSPVVAQPPAVPLPEKRERPKKQVPGQPFQQREVAQKDVGPFITCLARDNHGNTWAGTEDKGVFRHQVSRDAKSSERSAEVKSQESEKWTQFTGIGDDNAYAIACDKLGRVWVGTLNHGVNVFNGKDWRNYDVLDGPIGERIFAIATCPTDGDVWLATSAGLTRYSLKDDHWSYYTRTDGLPSDQANALAFDQEGNIYVGTQCDGIALAKAAEDYKKWTQVSGPDQLPTLGRGEGLPCNLINALLVAQNGTIYAGTTAGLARSHDKGKTWSYMRGRDYADKVRGRFGGAPAGWQQDPPHKMDRLLPEDYVTCLAEDDAGLLWIGFRQQGYVAINPKNDTQMFRSTKKTGLPDDYVNTLLPAPDQRHFIGTYGGGLTRAKHTFKEVAKAKATKIEPALLPSPTGAPTLVELNSMMKGLRKTLKAKSETTVLTLADDWKTQGDFHGLIAYRDLRYGEGLAKLCAFNAPFDAECGRDGMRFFCWGRTGVHARKGEGLRHWVQWAKTDNVRCLKNPFAGNRCQSEWDDHKETYPLTHDGPHIYMTVKTPPGAYYLSLYFHNKDGHTTMNRLRDYTLTIKSYCGESDDMFMRTATLARARMHNFWGGAYKTFLVSGNGEYTLELNANWSFNTICSGVFLDPIIDDENYAEKNHDIPRVLYNFRSEEAEKLLKWEGDSNPIHLALACFGELERLRHRNPIEFNLRARKASIFIMRSLSQGMNETVPATTLDRIMATCSHNIRFFDQRDRLYSDLAKIRNRQ